MVDTRSPDRFLKCRDDCNTLIETMDDLINKGMMFSSAELKGDVPLVHVLHNFVVLISISGITN